MKDSEELHFKNFFLDKKTLHSKKKAKKFKIIENPEPLIPNFEKPKTEIFTTLKRGPNCEISEMIKIEDELMQSNVKKKHILHKTEDVIIKENSLNEKLGKIHGPIFKTKKFLHKKIESGVSQTMHCITCKIQIPFSTKDLKCLNCLNVYLKAPKSESHLENFILKDVIKVDELINKHKKSIANEVEKIDKNIEIDSKPNESLTLLKTKNKTDFIDTQMDKLESSNIESFHPNLNVKNQIRFESPESIKLVKIHNPPTDSNINLYSDLSVSEVKNFFLQNWIQNETKRIESSNNLIYSLEVLNNLYNSTLTNNNKSIINNFPCSESFVRTTQNINQDSGKTIIQQIKKSKREIKVEERPVLKINISKTKLRIIPPQYTSKIMKIWDFFNSFKDEMECNIYIPEEIYIGLISPDNSLLEELHCSLLNLFSKEIISMQMNEIQGNSSLLLIKVFLIYTKNKTNYCWLEILINILRSCKYMTMLNEKSVQLLEFIKDINIEAYSKDRSIEEKIDIFEALINASFDLHFLKLIIDQQLNKKIELVKEKKSLEYELKTIKSRKKELKITEYYLNAKSRIEAFNKKLILLEEKEQDYTRAEYLKLKHDLEGKREKYNSAIIEMSNLDISKMQINSRIADIKNEKISLNIHKKRYIGIDEEGIEYYFFKDLVTRLYFRKKNENNQYEMSYYNNEEEITLLLDKIKKENNSKTLLANLNKIFASKLKLETEEKDEEIYTRMNNRDKEYNVEKKCIIVVIERTINCFIENIYIKYLDDCGINLKNKLVNLLHNSENISDYVSLLKHLFNILKDPNIIPNNDKLRKKLIDIKYKFIPKEYEILDLDNQITEYLDSRIKTKDNLFFISFILEGLTENLIKTLEKQQNKKPKVPRFLASLTIGNLKNQNEDEKESNHLYSYRLISQDISNFNKLIFLKIKENNYLV